MLLWIWLGYNVLVMLVYGLDKIRAKRGWRRTPEATLLWMAALCGAAGAWVGIFVLRHKSRKPRFVVGVSLMLVAQIALLLWWRFW